MHKNRFGFRAGSPCVGRRWASWRSNCGGRGVFHAIERHLQHQQPLAELNRRRLAGLHGVVRLCSVKSEDLVGSLDLERPRIR